MLYTEGYLSYPTPVHIEDRLKCLALAGNVNGIWLYPSHVIYTWTSSFRPVQLYSRCGKDVCTSCVLHVIFPLRWSSRCCHWTRPGSSSWLWTMCGATKIAGHHSDELTSVFCCVRTHCFLPLSLFWMPFYWLLCIFVSDSLTLTHKRSLIRNCILYAWQPTLTLRVWAERVSSRRYLCMDSGTMCIQCCPCLPAHASAWGLTWESFNLFTALLRVPLFV